jgi:hypothetical protein
MTGRLPSDRRFSLRFDGRIRKESIMRGRKPMGPEVVDRLVGSAPARLRVKVILQTMTGELRVQEACTRLQLSEQRFDELRLEAIQAAIAALETKPAGRPPRASESAVVAELQQQVAELNGQLQAALLRAELAASLPRRGQVSKKSRPRTSRS